MGTRLRSAATSAARLERWIGPELLGWLALHSKDVACHVPVMNVPGQVFAYRGDFHGQIAGGGFASLSDLISEITTGGKRQDLQYFKQGVTKTAGRGAVLWNVGAVPLAGGVGGATGTGAARTRTSPGALTQANAAGGDTLHVIGGVHMGTVGTNLLLLYDRLWDMNHTMTVDPRSVDGANPPTRYQTAALAPGSFISGEVTTILPAATPTITCTYTDQDGVDTVGPAFSTIVSGAVVGTIPFTAPAWKYPIDAADTGVRKLANNASAFDLSAAMASGAVDWFVGHPLSFIPIPTANIPVVIDGVNSYIQLARVYDDACLGLLELPTGTVTATNYWGNIALCSG